MATVQLEGKMITKVRPMTDEEKERNFPYGHNRRNPPVIVLDDGTKLFPSMDGEGNGPGELFGESHDEEDQFMVILEQAEA